MTLTFEKLRKKDKKAVRHLIEDAWYSDIENKYTRWLYVHAYTRWNYMDANWLLGAYDGDKLMGIVFGKIGKRNPVVRTFHRALLHNYAMLAVFTKAGRHGIGVLRETESVNRKLLAPFKKELDTELCLFIVDESARGQGIGKRLIHEFECELGRRGKKRYFLYTDTYSDYSFYDRHGYERLGEVNLSGMDAGEEKESIFYIYKKELEEKKHGN